MSWKLNQFKQYRDKNIILNSWIGQLLWRVPATIKYLYVSVRYKILEHAEIHIVHKKTKQPDLVTVLINILLSSLDTKLIICKLLLFFIVFLASHSAILSNYIAAQEEDQKTRTGQNLDHRIGFRKEFQYNWLKLYNLLWILQWAV